ncbi:MAG: NADH-quinone oxidoreductase subunit NuoN [Alphaproteobacteria bacterium]|nr:NADH-quinone oxidoreductase subunit NuoN [Alphaproteobacteria bacterium]
MTILSNITLIIPELYLVIMAIGVLVVGIIQGNKATSNLCLTALISYAVAIVLLLHTNWNTAYILNNMLVIDEFSGVIKLIILLGMIVTTALSTQYLHQERIAHYEYPVLMMLAGVGMMFMVSSNNLLALYMSMELQSLSLYILTAFRRNSARSGEAATKYFILGALSSGIMLFGISLIYGFSGSLDFTLIAQAVSKTGPIPPSFTIGMVFIIAALAFKISAAPFHMWTPDVYQGAPTSVTAFFSIVPKIAALALLMRVIYGPFSMAQEQWEQILYFVSLASLLIGAFGGLAQNNIKRLMAYSAISHMGYMLIGLVVGSETGIAAVILYLLIYMVITAGIFAVILCMRKNGMATYSIDALSGLSVTNPMLAYAMAVLMFAISGIPPFAGFFGKFFIFNAAIAQGYYVLALSGVIASVVAAYYYLRIIKVMFFDKPIDPLDNNIGIERRVILLGSLVFVTGFIIIPAHIITFANGAASSLF